MWGLGVLSAPRGARRSLVAPAQISRSPIPARGAIRSFEWSIGSARRREPKGGSQPTPSISTRPDTPTSPTPHLQPAERERRSLQRADRSTLLNGERLRVVHGDHPTHNCRRSPGFRRQTRPRFAGSDGPRRGSRSAADLTFQKARASYSRKHATAPGLEGRRELDCRLLLRNHLRNAARSLPNLRPERPSTPIPCRGMALTTAAAAAQTAHLAGHFPGTRPGNSAAALERDERHLISK